MVGLLGLLSIISFFTIIEIILFENDLYGWSTVVMICGLIGAWVGLTQVHDYVASAGWQSIAIDFGYYLAIGIAVAFGKWIQFNVKFSVALAEVKAKVENFNATNLEKVFELFGKIRNSNHPMIERAISPDAGGRYHKEPVSSMDDLIDCITPKAKQNVDRISAWIATWPFVIAHTVFADFIIKIGKHVATFFDAIFSKFTRAIVARGLK